MYRVENENLYRTEQIGNHIQDYIVSRNQRLSVRVKEDITLVNNEQIQLTKGKVYIFNILAQIASISDDNLILNWKNKITEPNGQEVFCSINHEETYTLSFEDGIATMEFVSELEGRYEIIFHSPSYQSCKILVEVV